jgi:hypothetical protein
MAASDPDDGPYDPNDDARRRPLSHRGESRLSGSKGKTPEGRQGLVIPELLPAFVPKSENLDLWHPATCQASEITPGRAGGFIW